MDAVSIIKIGGKVADDEDRLDDFLVDFVKVQGQKILVHGGGIIASKTAEKLGIKPKMVDGRRITDKAMLDIAVMVYGGLINKKIVARLQSLGVNAVGLTGTDLNIIQARKRNPEPIDFGWVGDISQVRTNWLRVFLDKGIVPVIAPLTHNGKGSLLNTNADSIASFLAIKMAEKKTTDLMFCFDQPGVLNNGKVVKKMNAELCEKLQSNGAITEGMIPKLQLGFKALEEGVRKVQVKGFDSLHDSTAGTVLE